MRTSKVPRRLSRSAYALHAGVSLLVLLTIWQALIALHLVTPLFLPSPMQILHSLSALFTSASFWGDMLTSVTRIAIGFMLSSLVSIPVGMLLATQKSIEAALEPLISFVRYIPPSSFVPLSILWLGVGETQKVFIVFMAVAPYLVVMVADAVSQVRREYLDAAALLGVHGPALYRKVILPFALPMIWDAMRLMIGAAWTFIILVEIVAATSGLGHVVIHAQRFLQTATVIAVMIVIGVLGLLTDQFFRIVALFWFPWTERLR